MRGMAAPGESDTSKELNHIAVVFSGKELRRAGWGKKV